MCQCEWVRVEYASELVSERVSVSMCDVVQCEAVRGSVGCVSLVCVSAR